MRRSEYDGASGLPSPFEGSQTKCASTCRRRSRGDRSRNRMAMETATRTARHRVGTDEPRGSHAAVDWQIPPIGKPMKNHWKTSD